MKLKTLYAIADYLAVDIYRKSVQLLYIGERFLTPALRPGRASSPPAPAPFKGRPAGLPLQGDRGHDV